MAIVPPNLDDRRFQDIVDEMKRMIPRFTPEWTNHNVADPGVALIELFAWASEMVLFRVNQVPDRLYTHFLNLVGIEPFPPSQAHTALTFWLSTEATSDILVPGGTEVSTADTDGSTPVVFSTEADAVVTPQRLVAARAALSGSDLTMDVSEPLGLPDAEVTVFGSLAPSGGDALYLGLDGEPSAHVLRLDVEAHAEGVGIDPRTPPLMWEAWTGQAWTPVSVESDSTGGLNKDGSVVLLMPQNMDPLLLDGANHHWLRIRQLPAVTGAPAYQASPRLKDLKVHAIGITVAAEHSRRVPAESVGRSAGVPGQSFTVANTPVAGRREGEQVEIVVGDHVQVWDEVSDFAQSGPNDRHVVWDSATGELRFGPNIRQPDGTRRQCGAVPSDGAFIRVSGYRTGGGAEGNVGAGTLVNLRTSVPFVAAVSNLAPATGGVDAETSTEAKARGPLALRSGNRAVTASDYEQITRQVSVEVARARCVTSDESGRAPVTVLVVPRVRTAISNRTIDDFALNTGLRDHVAEALDESRPMGVAVEVAAPFYQGISVAVLIRGLPGRPAAVLKQRIGEAISRYVDPLDGGPDGAGWPFGAPLTATTVSQVVESVDGVLGVDELQLFEYDLRSRRRIGDGRDQITLSPRSLFLSADHRVVVR